MNAPLASEQDLLVSFIEAVPFALPHVRVFRRQIFKGLEAMAPRGGTFRVHAGIPGQADAYALIRGGRHVEIETKAAKHKWYAEQIAWRSYCEREQIPYLVLRAEKDEHPSDTVNRWIEALRVVA